jgi:hypothetical protein
MAKVSKPAKRQKNAKPRSATNTGAVFANPRPSADDFDSFNPQDVFADTNVTASPDLEPIPKPRKQPPVMALSDILGTASTQQITETGSITIHCVGDTGGVKEPSKQFAVADAMTADIGDKTYPNGRPAFFFHLGDVIYYFGQEQYYYDQFYDPYRDYDAPIFAIPGNHDGVVSPSLKLKTLQGFLENFCTKKPSHNPEAQGNARTTMPQPGVYFTLDAPFVKIIGLYSNTSEGTTEGVIAGKTVGQAQLTFLQQQLKSAAQERAKGDHRALLIAVHHPPFTGSNDHAPSPTMLKDIDSACQHAKIFPDMVLSGHAHLYERYTRFVGSNQIPFLVLGCGGYFNLSKMKTGKDGSKPKPGVVGTDGKGNKLRLESFNDTSFGFMRLTISPTALHGEFIAVDINTKATSVTDKFSLDLGRHVVS